MLTFCRGNEVCPPCYGGDCCDVADCHQVFTDSTDEAFLDYAGEACHPGSDAAVEEAFIPSFTTEVSIAVEAEVFHWLEEGHLC